MSEDKDKREMTEEAAAEFDAEDVVSDEIEDGAEAEEDTEANKPAEDEQAKYARLYAEYENYRKRTEKEKSETYNYAIEKFAVDLLEVVDNFERALSSDAVGATSSAGAVEADGESFREGIGHIYTQLQNVLEKNGVSEIEAKGAEFDPALHHAVMTEEAKKKSDAGKVSEVLQKGYKIKDKVIRPAMVKVAQ